MDDALVKSIAIQVGRRIGFCVSLDDLIQAGRIGCWQAEQKYRPDVGTTFRQFASARVLGSIHDYLRELQMGGRRNEWRRAKSDIDWDHMLSAESGDTLAIRSKNRALIDQALDRVGGRHAEILRRHYLLEMPTDQLTAQNSGVYNVRRLLRLGLKYMRRELAAAGVQSLSDL